MIAIITRLTCRIEIRGSWYVQLLRLGDQHYQVDTSETNLHIDRTMLACLLANLEN